MRLFCASGNAIPSFDLLAAVSALDDVRHVWPMIAGRRREIDTGDDAMSAKGLEASRTLPDAMRGIDYGLSRDPSEPRVIAGDR